ncbi:MAG TPA: DUF167 domain-containing protein [Candidatus Limnocylindrales bacterium]|nr:DUF167 domain-containing protein [Candidatus Limnocylindrales bacterium]
MAGADELRIEVRLTPRAGVDRIDGAADGVLRCRVAAPPVDGAANDALRQLLADALDLPPSAVRLVAGERGRRKVVTIPASRRPFIECRWPGLLR